MSNDEDRIGAALRGLAESLDVTVPEPPVVEPARPVALKVAAATIAIAALVTVGLVIGGRDRDARRLAPTVESTVDASLPAASTTIAPSPATTTSVAPTTVAPVGDLLTRPVIDMAGCTTTWARESRPGKPHLPYARSSTEPVAIQVFASASGSINDPYVVVERFFDSAQFGPHTQGAVVNGQAASVSDNGRGGGQAAWVLPDGSEVYVRDHLFDKAALLEVVRALIPRPADSPVPGFDIATPAPFGLKLLDETYDPFVGSGGASSGCTLASGVELRAVLIRGRPVYTFASYLDQSAPYPAVEMLPDGSGTLAVVSLQAPADAAAALPTVRQAADDDWQRWQLSPRRDEIDAGIGILPIDQPTLDLLAGRKFTSLDEIQTTVVDLLSSQVPAAEAADVTVSAEVLTGNLVGPVIVVTRTNLDDSVIATVWFVEVSGTAPNLTVTTVTMTSRCRGGQLLQPGIECV